MLFDRNLRVSMVNYARGLFRNPPGGELSAYTVYGEEQLRLVAANQLTPVRPCVFIVDEYIRPVVVATPLVVAEVSKVVRRPFELGNRKGGVYECSYHVIGRMRGERDDLATFLCNNLTSQMPIYDYSSGSTLLEYGLIGDEVEINPFAIDSEAALQEASLDYWHQVSFTMQTKR